MSATPPPPPAEQSATPAPSAPTPVVPYGPTVAEGLANPTGPSVDVTSKAFVGTAGNWAVRLLLPLVLRAVFRAIFR